VLLQVPLVGMSVDFSLGVEPCGNATSSEPQFNLTAGVPGGTSFTLFQASFGQVSRVPIPGLEYMSAGAFVDVNVSGTLEHTKIEIGLSLCIGGTCDGSIPIIGGAVAAAGFPIQLTGDDGIVSSIPFQCQGGLCVLPASVTSKLPLSCISIEGIAGGVVVILLVGICCCCMRKKRSSEDGGLLPVRVN
jgi:hypothetical protein